MLRFKVVKVHVLADSGQGLGSEPDKTPEGHHIWVCCDLTLIQLLLLGAGARGGGTGLG